MEERSTNRWQHRLKREHPTCLCRLSSPVSRVARCQSGGWSSSLRNATCPRFWPRLSADNQILLRPQSELFPIRPSGDLHHFFVFSGDKGLDVANQNRASGGGRKMFLTSPLQELDSQLLSNQQTGLAKFLAPVTPPNARSTAYIDHAIALRTPVDMASFDIYRRTHMPP